MGTTPRRTGLPVRKRDGENGLTKSTEENHDLNIFETVKAAVTVKQAAEYCGLNVNRNNMVSCPFHDDRHPSMKLNEDYFYCFGCGASGDVIDLVAKLFKLSCLEAAKKLAEDFGIGPDKPPSAGARSLPGHDMEDPPEPGCPGALRDYIHLLETWKKDYAPADYGSNFDNRYAEACRELDYMKYLAKAKHELLKVGNLPYICTLVDEATNVDG